MYCWICTKLWPTVGLSENKVEIKRAISEDEDPFYCIFYVVLLCIVASTEHEYAKNNSRHVYAMGPEKGAVINETASTNYYA